MVEKLYITAAVWGKRSSSTNNTPDPYEELAAPRNWSDEACSVWKGLLGRFEWKQVAGSPAQTHATVLGRKRLSNGDFLMVRFRDMGRDNSGRPHTLRIEAVILTGSRISAASQLLDSLSWLEVSDSGEAIIQLPNLAPATFVDAGSSDWFMFGEQSTFSFKPDEQIQPTIHSKTSPITGISSTGQQYGPAEALRTLSHSTSADVRDRSQSKIRYIVLIIVVLGFLLAINIISKKPDPKLLEEVRILQSRLDGLATQVERINESVDESKRESEIKNNNSRVREDKFNTELNSNRVDFNKKLEYLNQKISDIEFKLSPLNRK